MLAARPLFETTATAVIARGFHERSAEFAESTGAKRFFSTIPTP